MVKPTLLIATFVLIAQHHCAQDTLYYDHNENQVRSLELAAEYKVVRPDSLEDDRATVYWYKTDGTPQKSIEYFPYSKEVREGETRQFYNDGSIKEEVIYRAGKMQGPVKTYYRNGQLRRHDLFEEDEFVKGTCWDSTGVEVEHTPFIVRPEFPGGEAALFEFLGSNMRYPLGANLRGESGIVYAQFVIAKSGEVKDVRILKGVSKALDRETLRVISNMPNWKPGTREGEIVDFNFNLPVRFTTAK